MHQAAKKQEKERVFAQAEYTEEHVRRLSPARVFKSLCKIAFNTLCYAAALTWGSVEVIIFYIRQRFFGNAIPNYHEVDGVTLLRGGQPSTKGLRELAKRGVKTIINLRASDFNRKVIEEYHADQIRTVHIPFYPYNPDDRIMIDFLKIMKNKNHTPTFVHCFHGADRTGAVIAIYRIILQNWDKDRAIAEMKLKGFHWWHWNLIDYIRKLDVDYIRSQI